MAQTKNEFGWTLLATATASASATIDFDSIPSGYKHLVVLWTQLIPATDDTELYLRVDYGAGYIATGYAYGHQTWEIAGASTNDTGITTSITVGGDSSAGWGVGSGANEAAYGEVIVQAASDASNYTHFAYNFNYVNSVQRHGFGSGNQGTNGAVSGIRFLMSSGNIASGEFKLYGIN